ncbi:hypothetical protein MTHERMMSTA1_03730 [Methanosarcina thermophila MST-A1]|nr:hypothetical protein MTHERMMSTA1_03730 [Methanosarcina thermophila MST-A1]
MDNKNRIDNKDQKQIIRQFKKRNSRGKIHRGNNLCVFKPVVKAFNGFSVNRILS